MLKKKVFIRQPFTESDQKGQSTIQEVMDLVSSLKTENNLEFLTPPVAQNSESFKLFFENQTGKVFTPSNFRKYRLQLLDQADMFLIIRTTMSESSSFEVSYNIFKGSKAPMFFAVHEDAPIKTTLLKDLEEYIPTQYQTFKEAGDLRAPLKRFVNAIKLKES